MISVEKALDLISAEIRPLPIQTTDLFGAKGRILGESLSATHSSPPFDASAMDGFAVRVEDCQSGENGSVRLDIQGEILAGQDGNDPLKARHALRINTGAPIPPGADAVVRIEDTAIFGDEVEIHVPPKSGTNLRRAGEDYRDGEVLLHAGQRIDSRTVGMLASLGCAEVPVARKPRVALLATGDELVEPGGKLEKGQIFNSNRYALAAQLAAWGAEVHDLGLVQDTLESTKTALTRALKFDVAITTGGVSMGSHDFVRPALADLGAKEIFWKVRQRPGKPLLFTKKGDCLCFGLPGNPVSVYLTAVLYVRSTLLQMQRATEFSLPWRSALAGQEFKKKTGLSTFVRVNAGQNEDQNESAGSALRAYPLGAQGSHQFSGLGAATGVVWLREDAEYIADGERVDYLDLASID